jgi:citrate synthase
LHAVNFRAPAAKAAMVCSVVDDNPHPEHPHPSSRRYGERFRQLLHGRRPSEMQTAVFASTQILQLDHGFDASTLTA